MLRRRIGGNCYGDCDPFKTPSVSFFLPILSCGRRFLSTPHYMEKRTLFDLGGPMTAATPASKILRSTSGQSLVELTLIVPLMLLMVYGVIEVGSIISTYLTLTHTTREGANLASRGTDPTEALAAVIAAAAPTIRNDNLGQWKIIYTKIAPAPPPAPACTTAPCDYVIEDQLIQGSLGENSKLGPKGAIVNPKLDPLDDVAPNQIFHSIEVFYDYGPNVMTFVGTNMNKIFYDRTIFTNVSAIN
jgi:hypothetical protein